jgi:hypothetical protein
MFMACADRYISVAYYRKKRKGENNEDSFENDYHLHGVHGCFSMVSWLGRSGAGGLESTSAEYVWRHFVL